MKQVLYRGSILAKNSDAYKLWEDMQKNPKVKTQLDAHMKALDKKNLELMERYDKK